MAPHDASRAIRVRLAAELRLDLASVERRAVAVAELVAALFSELEA